MASPATRVAAGLIVRDAVDLIADALDHLRILGVDPVIVVDIGSGDGTRAIVADRARTGGVRLLRAADHGAALRDLVGQLTTCDADWLVALDAEDRLLTEHASLTRLLDGYPEAAVVAVDRYPVVLGPERAMIAAADEPEASWLTCLHAPRLHPPAALPAWRRIPPLVRVRSAPVRLVRRDALSDGSGHDPAAPPLQPASGSPEVVARDAIVARIGFSSWARFSRALDDLRARPEEAALLPPETRWAWRRWAALEDSTLVRDVFAEQRTPGWTVGHLRVQGLIRPVAAILAETRVAGRASPLPAFPDRRAYDAALASADAWRAGFRIAMEQAGLDPATEGRFVPRTKVPTLVLASGVVLKLYGPWRRGPYAMAGEAEVLAAAAADPPLPVPRLLGTGWVDREWSWLAMSALPGVPLLEVRDRVSRSSLSALATWLGDVVRRLHGVPVEAGIAAVGRAHLARRLRWDRAHLVERQRAFRTLPPHLLDGLEDWMPTLDELCPPDAPLAFVHADLHEGNLLGMLDGDRFTPSGVVDFDNAGVGHPADDLGPICGQVLRGDPELIRRFLERAGLIGRRGPGLPRRALAWMLLHGADQLATVPGVTEAPDLDALAARLFGDT